MTEERKQELKQLLNEATARENLQIRYGYDGPIFIPVDVYERYLQERWAYYGMDFLSFWRSTRFTPDIIDRTTKSKLLDFIIEELSLFMERDAIPDLVRDSIPTSTYFIERNPTDGFNLNRHHFTRLHLSSLLGRLLEIALARGIDEAVSVFEAGSCPEGTYRAFQHVALLEGIKLITEVQIFEGVRLVPLPSSEISEELLQSLHGFSGLPYAELLAFFRNTSLLIIDRPGFSIFHQSYQKHQDDYFVENLPSQVKGTDVRFSDSLEVKSFQNLFCQALSLVCNSAVQIVHAGWFWAEDRSFNLNEIRIETGRHLNLYADPAESGESEIEEAIHLYKILISSLDSAFGKKLQIAIDRWVRSWTNEDIVDSIIDLGIAFEVLYVPDSSRGEIRFKLAVRAAWHLGSDKEDRFELLKQFKQIYDYRSQAVHSGQLAPPVKFGEEEVSMSQFIARTRDICRKSIVKVLEDERFPDWNSLILGSDKGQANS